MPLPSKIAGLPPASLAVKDLGLGDMLGQQVAGETEEMRKKRMAQMQQGGTGGSLATFSLFGSNSGAA